MSCETDLQNISSKSNTLVTNTNLTNTKLNTLETVTNDSKTVLDEILIELKKLDIRLRAGTTLLTNHVAISDFLESLAESTLPQVSFSSFSFTGEKKMR